MKIRSIFLGTLILACFLYNQLGSQESFDPKIAALMDQVSRANLQTHIENLANADGYQTRASYTDGNLWAVDYMKKTFESFPGLTVDVDTFFVSSASPPFNSDPLFNVVATLQGSGAPSQYYVIGGHSDATADRDNNLNWDTDWPTAKAPGADDNASGVASILEIARILSDPTNQFDNTVTIKFVAFGAEEFHPIYSGHHLGAKYFVQQAYQKGDAILGAYISDMIGYNNTGYDYFNIVSNTNSRGLGEKMLEINSVYQLDLESNQLPFPEAIYSDHDQFWNYRYKAILLIENAPPWENKLPFYRANPFYHTQDDIPAAVNLAQVEKVTKSILGTIATLTDVVTAVESDQPVADVPQLFSLEQNYPNPFNAGTVIRYGLQSGGYVKLSVSNLRGQKVVTLVNGPKSVGEYSITWNGRNAYGEEVPTGIYLCSLEVGDKQLSRKLLLIK